jgi:hypothetical protein
MAQAYLNNHRPYLYPHHLSGGGGEAVSLILILNLNSISNLFHNPGRSGIWLWLGILVLVPIPIPIPGVFGPLKLKKYVLYTKIRLGYFFLMIKGHLFLVSHGSWSWAVCFGCLVLPCLALPCLVLPHFVLSCLVLPHFVLSCLVLSFAVLSA